MRKIKFRGKRTDTGQWVYGYYVFQRARGGIHGQQMTADDLDRHLICSSNSRTSYEVYPTTIGQFTGLKDKNGVDIYEGDICDEFGFSVAYSDGTGANLGLNVGWYIQRDNWESWCELTSNLDCEVIGNIHEGVTE